MDLAALRRHIGSGCRRWVGPVLADDHVSGLRVSRPVDVSRTYQDLSLGMVRNTRRISTLTPSAGHHWWYGDFATGMASACPPAVSAILRVADHSPAILSMSALACSHQLTVRVLPPCALPAAFLEPGAASSIPPVTKQNRLQHAVFWLRRCSLAFMISLMSPAGRISKMLPNVSAGCWPISCTAWFMSLASRTRMPPSCSLVSA
jgi:hypothetical protein